MSGDVLIDHFNEQAGWCADIGSPFMDALCRRAGHDIAEGGPVADLLGDWTGNPRRDAVALRLAGALHFAILNGQAPSLAAAYPTPDKPDWSMEVVWPLAQDFISNNLAFMRAFMAQTPQTNETRRAICLLAGFLDIAAEFEKPMNLLELGASAGLNMNWDRFTYRTDSWRYGDGEVLIATDWQAAPPDVTAVPVIAERAACDINPLNVDDPDEALRLRAYLWPDQFDRLERFDGAVALARKTGFRPEKADALDWLTEKLAARPDGAVTVVYHSVFFHYPPQDVRDGMRAAIEAAGRGATDDAPVAWLCFEPATLFGSDVDLDLGQMVTRLQTWPGGEVKYLNQSNGHVTRVLPI